jgi:hypothetical protein
VLPYLLLSRADSLIERYEQGSLAFHFHLTRDEKIAPTSYPAMRSANYVPARSELFSLSAVGIGTLRTQGIPRQYVSR